LIGGGDWAETQSLGGHGELSSPYPMGYIEEPHFACVESAPTAVGCGVVRSRSGNCSRSKVLLVGFSIQLSAIDHVVLPGFTILTQFTGHISHGYNPHSGVQISQLFSMVNGLD